MAEPDGNKVVHEVDGIQEYDNQLPRWWLVTLYLTVAFAVVYWFGWQVLHIAETPRATWEREMAEARAKEAAAAMALGEVTSESLETMARSADVVDQGKQVFASTCAACHRADGGGTIGPNLTDEYWLHGGAPTAILERVRVGVPDKGMPAWAAQLGETRVRAVTAYVLTLRNTNVAGGKPPQGERTALRQP